MRPLLITNRKTMWSFFYMQAHFWFGTYCCVVKCLYGGLETSPELQYRAEITLLQSNFNDSNIFGTMEICSRHG